MSITISWIFIAYTFYDLFVLKNIEETSQNRLSKDDMNLLIGNNLSNNLPTFIPEKGLYQNVLITGTIGTGKTSSAMYPFVNQLLSYDVGMLILDVKGNFYSKVLELNKTYSKKIIVIELGRRIYL